MNNLYTKDTLIEDVTMSSRLRKFLIEDKICPNAKILGDLMEIPNEHFLNIRGFGNTTLEELEDILFHANTDITEIYLLKINLLKVNFTEQHFMFNTKKERIAIAEAFFALKEITKMFDIEISHQTTQLDTQKGKILSKMIEKNTVYQINNGEQENNG